MVSSSRRRRWYPLAAAASLLVARVGAHPQYVARIPNGGNVEGVAALGHVDPSGGGERNAFGQAFANSGLRWTAALCAADSDGDGQTNGQELGDPCCVWTERADPVYVDGVSAPGDAASMADPALWANTTCVGLPGGQRPFAKATPEDPVRGGSDEVLAVE